jgi:hypothetical protein
VLDRGYATHADLRARPVPAFLPLDAARGVAGFTLLAAPEVSLGTSAP